MLEALELEQCFSTLAESFIVVTALFSWDVLSAKIFFFGHKMLYHKLECGVFSPVYASLHEIERERKCDYILVCCVCVAVLSEFIHFC